MRHCKLCKATFVNQMMAWSYLTWLSRCMNIFQADRAIGSRQIFYTLLQEWLINLKILNHVNIGVIQDAIICKWDIYFLPCDFLLNWLADTYCNHHNEKICFGHLFGKYHIHYNGTVLCFHHQITYIQGKNTEKIKGKVV